MKKIKPRLEKIKLKTIEALSPSINFLVFLVVFEKFY